MKENSLLKEIALIAKSMYEIADAMETNSIDEKWRTASKLKNSANDSYFYLAQVVGAGENNAIEFDCINARKNLTTLKSMYVFAAKQGMADLDPELIVKIEKLIIEVDEAQRASEAKIKQKTEEELKPWLEKYRIWQKISKD